jgi:DNA-binding XRE family transcriptional regulator
MPKNNKPPRITKTQQKESRYFNPLIVIDSFAKARILSAKTLDEVAEQIGVCKTTLHCIEMRRDINYGYKTLMAVHCFNLQWLPETEEEVTIPSLVV